MLQVWTYATMVLAFLVLLLGDFIGYRMLIILEAFGYAATRILLLFGAKHAVFVYQLVEFCYGIGTAAEVGQCCLPRR